ncbi:MAG: hypothetical protein A3C11_02385 [Candidatus Sungbacteria bacterium RIFCSPHIGHO2_02_FULL_49_12]|uniref:Uncharacterized protein n=1 Tax=Candidatus Sungbacteria bacterium RIFCSPHIGHO2_02_FULL_49_12 TaxID=1802271 RepID=A0A1G2KQ62_9BACT|nr:MAG: hypothetical protein A3C11_02385 [Candidatus Sungbacteria bacterium RIFCSPHIGHO2_02_FULL_49_12]
MYQEPLMLDRVLDFPASTTRMSYGDSAVEEKDIPTALNSLFTSLTEKLAKFSLFPLSIQTGWGEEWAGYDGMVPNGIFYVSVFENMFFRNHKLFGRSFKRQEHLRVNVHYNSNLNEVHIYFHCLGDYELAEPIIKEFFSLRPNLKIRCLVLYCFEDRLPERESTAKSQIQKLDRVFFASR